MTHDRPPSLDGTPSEVYRPAGPDLPPMPPPRRRRAGLVFLILLLAGSVVVNVVLVGVVSSRLEDLGGGGRQALQETVLQKADTKDTIAVIHVKGMITEEPMGGYWGPGGTTYDFLKQQVERALGDRHVRAVVLRVNSPGGGAAASDMMLHELKRLPQADKPIVVHMGSVAASGGYYVSMAADHIVAQPTCITGSIGVIGQIMTFQEMMESKLGIKVYTFTSGDYKDVGNPFREMTVDEQIYLEDTLIAPIFNRFVGVVDEGRKNLTERNVRDLANGKVYTAQQALDNGLVDQIGFFEDAVDEAMAIAGLTQARLVEYRKQVGLFDFLAMSSEPAGPGLLRITPDVVNAWSTPRVLMLWRP